MEITVINSEVIVTPVYLVKTQEHDGLISIKLIQESNEIKMYYSALGKLATTLQPYAKIKMIKMDLILNNYEDFSEEKYFIALKVVGDIMKICKRIKLHIFDESNAKKCGII